LPVDSRAWPSPARPPAAWAGSGWCGPTDTLASPRGVMMARQRKLISRPLTCKRTYTLPVSAPQTRILDSGWPTAGFADQATTARERIGEQRPEIGRSPGLCIVNAVSQRGDRRHNGLEDGRNWSSLYHSLLIPDRAAFFCSWPITTCCAGVADGRFRGIVVIIGGLLSAC
jgi:hypothetical protein